MIPLRKLSWAPAQTYTVSNSPQFVTEMQPVVSSLGRLVTDSFPMELGDFPDSSVVKNLPDNVRDVGLIPEWGKSPGGGHGNSLQYSCLENPMDRGAWRP